MKSRALVPPSHLDKEQQDGLGIRVQRTLVVMILERIANDKKWEELLDDLKRAAAVDALAEEALAEFNAGKSYPLSEVSGAV